MYSYGDLWYIIGTIVTRYDLTLNDTGLYIRVALQRGDVKREGLICLTSSPREMMEFLGLDAVQYSSRFGTIDEAFRWCAASRVFRSDVFEKESVSDKEARIQEKRPVYRKFVTEWLPQQPRTDGKRASDSLDRSSLVQEALNKFGKRPEYEQIQSGLAQKAWMDLMWRNISNDLKPDLEAKEMGKAMKVLKRCLHWDGGVPTLQAEEDRALPVEKSTALDEQMLNVLVIWAVDHWQEAVGLNESGTA